jgi:hypothetical protein
MRRLRDTVGSSVHRRHIRVHLSLCKGVSALHDELHDEASAVCIVLRDAERAREDAEDGVALALTYRARAEGKLENVIRDIEAEAKKLDRKDPALAARKAIFPVGIGPILRPEGSAQLDALPALRVRLAPLLAMGGMSSASTELEAAEAEFRAALASVAEAEAAADKAFALERAARRAVREQLEAAHGRLRVYYKANPVTAEAFFLRERTPAQEKTTTPNAETPNAGSEPAFMPS